MKLTKKQVADLAAMSGRMRSMAAEMNHVAGGVPVDFPSVKPEARHVQLQINASGAWRTGLDFDATDLPDEFFDHLDQVLRMACADKTTARVVMTRPGANGKPVGTHMTLKRWSRSEGWVNT